MPYYLYRQFNITRELFLILIISSIACLVCVNNGEYLRKLYEELWSPKRWRKVEIVDERSTFEELRDSYWDYMEIFGIGLMVCVVSSVTGCWTYILLRGRKDREHQSENKNIKERLQEIESSLREDSWYRNRLQDIGSRIEELDEHLKNIENKYDTAYSNPGRVASISPLSREYVLSREGEFCVYDSSFNTSNQENETIDLNCNTKTNNTTSELEKEHIKLHYSKPKTIVEKLKQTEKISPPIIPFDVVDTTNELLLQHVKVNSGGNTGMLRSPTSQKIPNNIREHENPEKSTDLRRDTSRLENDDDDRKISDSNIEMLHTDSTNVQEITSERPDDVSEAKCNLKIEQTPSVVKVSSFASPKPASARSLCYKMSYTQLCGRGRIPQYQTHPKEAKPGHKTATYSDRYKETSNKGSSEIQSRPNTACGDYAQTPPERQRKKNQKGYASCKTNI